MESTECPSRFQLFVHPEVKDEILKENSHSEENQNFVELISTPGYKLLSEIPVTKRRFIKSHFPMSLLPPSVMEQKCKVSSHNDFFQQCTYIFLDTAGYLCSQKSVGCCSFLLSFKSFVPYSRLRGRLWTVLEIFSGRLE